ncbi:hypothetical protein Tco_1488924, partial [Tanacetum coccineum]
TVMWDSKDSTVTYTEVSSPFEGLSDIGSLGVVGPEYKGLPWMLDDPYVQDEVFPTEEQPLPADVSPTADSPGYVSKSDSEEDPEEDPADYPIDGGDNGDDEDESSDDDKDDDVDIKGDGEEEEHPALANSTAVALPAVDHAPFAEETKPFKIDESAATPPPHPAYRITARMLIRDEPPTPFWSEAEIARLLAIPSPPPSPLSLWSSPLPQIPSPPLPVSPPSPVSLSPLPDSPTYPLGYRAAMIQLRAEAPSTSHLLPLPSPIVLPHTSTSMAMLRAAAPSTYILVTRSEAPPSGTPPLLAIPLPTPSPPLRLPSTDRRANVREACLPPWKRLCFAFGPRYERDVGYGITDTWDQMLVGMPGAPATDGTEDRRAHARIARLMKIEAMMSREAWGRSTDVSNLTCTEVMALHTQVVAHRLEITELRAADRRRWTQLTEALKLMKTIQTQLTTL